MGIVVALCIYLDAKVAANKNTTVDDGPRREKRTRKGKSGFLKDSQPYTL